MEGLEHQQTTERGSALVEFLLVIPFLITILIGVVDIGCALKEYFYLRNAVAAGAEYAMSASPLPANAPYVTNANGNCAGGFDPVHSQVHTRIGRMIQLQNRALKDPCIESKLFLETGDTEDYTVKVRVTAKYDALLPTFDGIKISAEARVPYLLTPAGSTPWTIVRGGGS